MKEIKIIFAFNGNDVELRAMLNDDVNCGMILADHPMNECVSAECGMADELGIWNLNFETEDYYYECDFMAETTSDGIEHLTLTPCEVLVWDKDGASCHNDVIHFSIEVEFK